MLTLQQLKSILDYDPETGEFTRKNTVSSRCGTVSKTGYLVISVLGKRYYAHRLAWLFVTGAFPEKDIDHINRVKLDNRITNLRDVPRSVNSRNTPVRSHNKLGHKNIKYDKRDGSYTVVLTVEGRQKSYGRFYSLREAINRKEAINATTH